jgi:Domain of unknown function (DUF4158)
MPPQEQFLSKRQRYQPLALRQHFSDEELVRNWTLVEGDHQEVARYRKGFRLYMALQICAVRVESREMLGIMPLQASLQPQGPCPDTTV